MITEDDVAALRATAERYFDFADFEEALRSECGKRQGSPFEPSAGKGAVARATLYFLLRSPGVIGDEARELQRERLGVLLAWHRDHPGRRVRATPPHGDRRTAGQPQPADRPSRVGGGDRLPGRVRNELTPL